MANEVEKQTGADNDGRSPQGQRILRKPTRLERGNPDGFEIRGAGRRENEVTTAGRRLIAGIEGGGRAMDRWTLWCKLQAVTSRELD